MPEWLDDINVVNVDAGGEGNQAMKKTVMRTLIVPVLALLTGCATTQFQPPQQVVWAFYSVVASLPDFKLIKYSPTKIGCLIATEEDLANGRQQPYQEYRVTQPCHQVVVVRGGTWWSTALVDNPNYGVAYSTRKECEATRTRNVSVVRVSECAPVTVNDAR